MFRLFVSIVRPNSKQDLSLFSQLVVRVILGIA